MTLKVTGNHVKFARFVLLPISEEAKTWLPFFRSMYNKRIIRYGFCDIQNIQNNQSVRPERLRSLYH